ncbi:zinc finger protein GAI-ASSOCIATED FACTOR 1 isoform X1 [Nicotiana tabacum]|uniref:Zinc finger protein GAI-ASSOCIATED FACTOR 1 isoform X1 n=2 Tax=Nicotiana tabacum TaxID=4097 RepID=A0AC58SBC1_TOBAC|nr:PREDICTED: protein indeterminate-domain 2-like isoform X1 [Nicotiana tabacum]
MAEMENSSSMTVAGSSLEETITQQNFPVKKKRNLPGNPDPEAEVIALSPKTLMATNRFVCEICNKGFQRDQNLQLHRRGHNLPWKLRQRTSKEVKKRVYVCPEAMCVHHDPSRALGDLTGIKKHFCRKHGEKKFKCERCTKKYAVQSDWKAHMKTCGTREYRCDCGTLFSRRDSFITHRAFCDALAQESARAQPMGITNTEENLKVDEAVTSSSSPPPQPLTPSTGVLSPVLSIQSSELPADNQNQAGVQLQAAQGTTPVSTTTVTATTISTTASITGPGSSKVFASVFPPSTTLAGHPHSSYSDILCAIGPEQISPIEPMSLSLSSSFYLSANDGSTLFQDHTGHSQHYGSTTQPVLSATALLQKAAQMGATSSNNSFLRGLGLAMSSTSASDNISRVKLENNVELPGLGIQLPSNGPSGRWTDLMMGPSHESMMFGNKPPTLDFLGLGNDANATSSNGFSALLSSMDGGFGVATTSYGGVATRGEAWDGHSDRKPSML